MEMKTEMKSLLFTAPYELKYTEQPVPEHEGMVLVKVEQVGICGSDLHAYHGHDSRRVPPIILGHEISGVVLNGVHQGKRVAINPQIHCEQCEFCLLKRDNLCLKRKFLSMHLPGGFAEMVAVPEKCLLFLNDDIGFVKASLAEPLAVVLHSLALFDKISFRPIEEAKVLVIGMGAIGLLSVLCLEKRGCAGIHVSERNSLRLKNIEKISKVEVAGGGKSDLRQREL